MQTKASRLQHCDQDRDRETPHCSIGSQRVGIAQSDCHGDEEEAERMPHSLHLSLHCVCVCVLSCRAQEKKKQHEASSLQDVHDKCINICMHIYTSLNGGANRESNE